MQTFLFKRRSRLEGLIEDIWRWENIKHELPIARQTRLEAMDVAAKGACVCNGAWTYHVRESLRLNHVSVKDLCRDILHALVEGRSEQTPIIVLAGARGGEGKSLLLKALYSVFGHKHVFSTPEKGSFALLHLPGRKVAFLDEWRFSDDVLSWSAQCMWYDGSVVSVKRPQNVPGQSGHLEYRGTAPIFVTTKLRDLENLAWWAADDPWTGEPRDAEASMIYRRLKVYEYRTRIPKPPAKTPFCARCFAQLIFHFAGYAPADPDVTQGFPHEV